MRELIFACLITFLSFLPAVAQENLGSSTESAALAGTGSELGVTFGGVSVASVTLASALISALIAFMVENNSIDGNNTTTSSSATN